MMSKKLACKTYLAMVIVCRLLCKYSYISRPQMQTKLRENEGDRKEREREGRREERRKRGNKRRDNDSRTKRKRIGEGRRRKERKMREVAPRTR